ncbi:MAG: hypothetical protein IBX50_14545 [Marinospirillum sp.]|uniref:defense against restriction DarA-related protein n=1 Tax=Marinospirillum sp. TaxID=2183934 RepID=UPI001A0AF8D8|nr:hypothetical protein [Marinospirillum sp.]MBE0507907.1 hypothetical protein [Marinospirillum sp.]
MNQNYAGSFKFDSFDAQGVEPIKKAFERAGATVIEVDAPNRASRRAGYQVKKSTFFLADGQQIMMLLKNDGEGNGDIYQVQLNSRVIPVKNVDDMSKAAAEIARMAKANSPAFTKAQRRKHQKLKVNESDLDGGKPKTAPATARAKLAETKAEAEEMDAQLAEQEQAMAEKISQLEAKRAENDKNQAEIDRLLAENEQLESAA